MAFLDSEGFGLSLSAGDYQTYGVWTLSQGLTSPSQQVSINGPSGDNYVSVWNGVKAWLHNAPSAASGTFIFGARVNLGGGVSSHSLFFNETTTGTGGTNQIGITISSAGAFTALRGMSLNSTNGYTGGTSLGTSSTGLIPLTGWQYLEVKAVIASGTSGSIEVRVNGSVVWTLTGINTQGGSTTNVQQYGFRPQNGSGVVFSITHIYFQDATGSAPNNDYLGDVRVQTLYPDGNDTVAFTPSTGSTPFNLPNGSNTTLNANTIYYQLFRAPASGVLSALTNYCNNPFTGSCQMALYSDNAGSPGSLLGSSAVVTSASVGTTTFSVSSGPTLVAGQLYWVAFLSNASWFGKTSQALSNQWGSQSRTYASGFPSSAGATLGSTSYAAGMTIGTSTTNWDIVAELAPATSTGRNGSSNVGDQDLLTLQAPGSQVGTIYGIAVKTLAALDSGSRSLGSVSNIGGTTTVGTGVALTTTPAEIKLIQATNPDTSAPWTVSDIGALKSGYKVTA